MIVKSDAFGSVCIPFGSSAESVELVPGYNDIPNDLWVFARANAKRRMDSGKISEEWTKVPAEEAAKLKLPEGLIIASDDAKEATKRLVPATLADIDRKGNKVLNIVKGTFHILTLNKWYNEELRADVRVELQKQIAGVESGEIKG